MWPVLLNMTSDECRRTLRRLELEAYSNVISVFRAQGALEDNRKKLLEELRTVLHISKDRHSAEARRVANDELLATIAEQLAGPNTGLGWICEGRRQVPLMPRGVAQSIYTEIADKAAEDVAAENKELQKKLEAEKLVAPKSNEEELPDPEGQTAESAVPTNDAMDELLYPPIATEDLSTKLWETELISRKRKLPEGGAIPDDAATPVKNVRNIPANTNQKHLNLSQIYSKFSQPVTSKPSGQSKHSYNQVSKVSTNKSNHPHVLRAPHKHRSQKQNIKSSTQIVISKHQGKKAQEMPASPGKQFNPSSLHMEYSGPPGSFQASYAQAVLGNKNKVDYIDEMKAKVVSSPGMTTESAGMQLLTQPATVPGELPDSAPPLDGALHAAPAPRTLSGKPCQLILKKRTDVDKKIHMPELKILQKPADVKLLSNRQVVVTPSPVRKALDTVARPPSLDSTATKPPTTSALVATERMIVVPKPTLERRNLPESKFVIASSIGSPSRECSPVISNSAKTIEALAPKGIPATDLKVSAKTFVLNPKSGQKMVVVPAKARTKTGGEGQMPILHFKGNFRGISAPMKLVPVGSQTVVQAAGKTPTVTVVSKSTAASAISSTAKVISMEPIKTANLADIVPVKGLAPISTPKMTNPIVRPATAKGSVIVVQKNATIGKALTFTKNGKDMSKIIMGKNVNRLLQASKPDHGETAKNAGNVIVLELNNDQTGRATTMSEILDSRSVGRVSDESKELRREITQDTPVLFDNQISVETCNASSLDSTAESISDLVQIETDLPVIVKDDGGKSTFNKESEGAKDSSSVTDWEMELDTVSRKDKDDDDKLNSLHLDLGMSSDSDNDFMDTHKSKSNQSSQENIQRATSSGDGRVLYSGSSTMSLATRTLLSQLQDDGSSSNDSSFAFKSKTIDKLKESELKLDKAEAEALAKAKEKLSEKVAEAKSRPKQLDMYTTSEINLDSFPYLEEGMMAGDDEFSPEDSKTRDSRTSQSLDDQLSRLLGEDSANSTDSQTVSENLPLNKQ